MRPYLRASPQGVKAMKTKSLMGLLCLTLLLSFTLSTWADDGDPVEFGPADEHQVSKIGQNQKILVILVQANDHRILPSELANLNTDEDLKITTIGKWFQETSWNKTTFNFDVKRSAGNNWYQLPEGILDYCSPSDIPAMEARDASQASSTNPTPPASITATAGPPSGGDPASDFDATEAGSYWYAVSSFKNGVESQLTRISSSVTVAQNDIVKLAITKAAAIDVDRYLIYRTGPGQADTLANYKRIGYAPVTGSSEVYIDSGIGLANLADHNKLLTAAMTAAAPDVPDFEANNGVIAIIHSSFLRGQSSGAATFTISGKTFKIQTINQSSETAFGRYAHEMGHWLTLADEYDPISAGARGYWTTMDGANDREYQSWEKEYKLAWIDPDPANVKSLERPPAGSPDRNETFKVVPTAKQETAADTYTAIKIKSSDSVHYYVEGRDFFTGNVSDASANNLVVVMEAVDAWPPGIYPKRNLNEQKLLHVGDPAHSPDPSLELSFTGTNAGPPESYNVNVKLKASPQPDPKITPWGAPPWETVDIWVDSEREGGGWDDQTTAVPKPDNGEAAWVNHINRIYAKITNAGEAEAKNVQVRFRVCSPGGVGDAGQFVDLPLPALVTIPPHDSRNVYAEWTPTVGEHTCIKVEIDHIPGEKDIYNNFAQENVTHFYTGQTSPWKMVQFPMVVANPFKTPKRVDLEIKGLKTGWKAKFSNKWVMLGPKEIKTVDVAIIPPADAPPCTKAILDIYGLIQIDDYIQVYGGINPIIHLANQIKFLRLQVTCNDQEKFTIAALPSAGGRFCRVTGLTEPPVRNAEISLIFTDSQGNYKIVFVRTDSNGRFTGTFTPDGPGVWTMQPYYAGDDCNAPTEGPTITVTVPPLAGPWKCCLLWGVFLAALIAAIVFMAAALSGVGWAWQSLATAGSVLVVFGLFLLYYCVPASWRCCSFWLLFGFGLVISMTLFIFAHYARRMILWYAFAIAVAATAFLGGLLIVACGAYYLVVGGLLLALLVLALFGYRQFRISAKIAKIEEETE
jgi:hypothetical protein